MPLLTEGAQRYRYRLIDLLVRSFATVTQAISIEYATHHNIIVMLSRLMDVWESHFERSVLFGLAIATAQSCVCFDSGRSQPGHRNPSLVRGLSLYLSSDYMWLYNMP